jgi:predicted TIM-barrel fold metal-dependent hydrolase
MPYAHREIIYDADTHMMERPDWISDFADADIRPRLAPFVGGRKETLNFIDDAIANFDLRRSDPAVAQDADDGFMSMRFKGWHGLGAFDAQERARANDLLGFKAHIVFPTEAFNQVIAASDQDVLIGGVRALNRGLEAFCAVDRRMMGTAYVPLGLGPEISVTMLEEIIAANFRVILIDTIAPRDGLSFTHQDYDPFWARVQEAGLSVVLHIGAFGGYYQPVPTSFYNNGRNRPGKSGGDAPSNALSYMAIQYNAELFLSAMIFDGVLERFPGLRIGVVELAASWIISWMKQLDQSYKAFRRLQDLSELKLLPSDYVQRQIKITPFAGEDIGWLLKSGAEDLLMFASDYPHHEGTDDPIGRFEKTMDGVTDVARDKFYADNFRAFIPDLPVN